MPASSAEEAGTMLVKSGEHLAYEIQAAALKCFVFSLFASLQKYLA